MRSLFFLVQAFTTLFASAYLALATVAVATVPFQLHHYLPPYGFFDATAGSRLVVLLLATWIALLSSGVLYERSQRSEHHNFAGALWFLLVLAAVWTVAGISLIVQVVVALFS